MKLLLDTHVLLWSLLEPKRLKPGVGELIAESDPVMVSIVSLWEVAIKTRVGKMAADLGVIIDELPLQNYRRIGIEDAHLRVLLGLPTIHRDPYDHLLIAQAISEGAALVTRDRKIMRYPVELIEA